MRGQNQSIAQKNSQQRYIVNSRFHQSVLDSERASKP
jgi:hypothetical protein